jgi:dolichol kinase
MDSRLLLARRVYVACLVYATVLTIAWLYTFVAGPQDAIFFRQYRPDGTSVGNVLFGFLFFNILWGCVWYGVKTLLLRRFVGFSKEETRRSFSSRMEGEPYDVAPLLARYSERRIRIADMVGRRGRFMTLGAAGFYYVYTRVSADPTASFLTIALADNLFDAVVFNWLALVFYRSSGFLGRMFYGPQSRVMDGTLARANCLLITMLWSAFKFVLVPIGAQLSSLFPPSAFGMLFALIWGTYMAADALSEVAGSIFGRQKLRVWGLGDVNRKSVAGTVAGFAAALALGVAVVAGHGLTAPWFGLVFAIAVSNTLLELYSPRGTDDFTMATANALLCWAFGAWILT